jgi:DNA-binding response OmpR family regulator
VSSEIAGQQTDADGDRERVLIVEDEAELAEMYASYLSEYETEIATGGEEALETVDGRFDVVLLDRRMPVVSGNEVLAAIEERGIDCRVAMVTAVDPDFDIIDLRIDDYVVKPVRRGELRETVDRLFALDEYDEQMQKLTTKRIKRNLLEVEKARTELSESEEFQRLQEEITALESEVESLADEIEIDD